MFMRRSKILVKIVRERKSVTYNVRRENERWEEMLKKKNMAKKQIFSNILSG